MTEGMVSFAMPVGDSSRHLVIEKFLAFPKPSQRLGGRADLREHPGGGSDRARKTEGDIRSSQRRNPVFEPHTRLRPVSFEKVELARGPVSQPNGERVMSRLGQLERLGLTPGRLGKLSELGETQYQPVAIVDRHGDGDAELLVHPVTGQRGKVVVGQLDCVAVVQRLTMLEVVVAQPDVRGQHDLFRIPADIRAM